MKPRQSKARRQAERRAAKRISALERRDKSRREHAALQAKSKKFTISIAPRDAMFSLLIFLAYIFVAQPVSEPIIFFTSSNAVPSKNKPELIRSVRIKKKNPVKVQIDFADEAPEREIAADLGAVIAPVKDNSEDALDVEGDFTVVVKSPTPETAK